MPPATEFDPDPLIRETFKNVPFGKNYLDRLKPKRLAKARESFASSMSEDERLLYLFDSSFTQNGSSGMLVSDRFVYGSDLANPIPLAQVFSVSTLGETQGVGTGGVFVNGQFVCKGDKIQFWYLNPLPELGEQARAAGRDWPPSPQFIDALDDARRPDLIHAAHHAAFAPDRADDEDAGPAIRSAVTAAGGSEAAASLLAERLLSFGSGRRPGYYFHQFLVGLIGMAVTVPLAILCAVKSVRAGLVVFGALATGAVALTASGFYFYSQNRKPPEQSEVSARWQSHCETLRQLAAEPA